MRTPIAAVLACLLASTPASAADEGPAAEAFARFQAACKLKGASLVIRWEALRPAYAEDDNFPFNEGIVTGQVVRILGALGDGCTGGLEVVDRVVVMQADARSKRFDRPKRKVPLERLSALKTVEITLNPNDAPFRAWQAENWGKPPVEVYRKILDGRYDAAVLTEELELLGRNPYTQLPPRFALAGTTLTIGVGSVVEIRAPWFERFLDLAIASKK